MGKPLKAIGGVFSNLFGSQKTPEIVKPEAVITPPSPEVAARAARKRLQERAQKGREGTIYSQAYSGSRLGGTA